MREIGCSCIFRNLPPIKADVAMHLLHILMFMDGLMGPAILRHIVNILFYPCYSFTRYTLVWPRYRHALVAVRVGAAQYNVELLQDIKSALRSCVIARK